MKHKQIAVITLKYIIWPKHNLANMTVFLSIVIVWWFTNVNVYYKSKFVNHVLQLDLNLAYHVGLHDVVCTLIWNLGYISFYNNIHIQKKRMQILRKWLQSIVGLCSLHTLKSFLDVDNELVIFLYYAVEYHLT